MVLSQDSCKQTCWLHWGFIIRNQYETNLITWAGSVPSVHDALYVEAKAYLVQVYKKRQLGMHGISRLYVETDSFTLVMTIKSAYYDFLLQVVLYFLNPNQYNKTYHRYLLYQ
jgi:hypothetical protein